VTITGVWKVPWSVTAAVVTAGALSLAVVVTVEAQVVAVVGIVVLVVVVVAADLLVDWHRGAVEDSSPVRTLVVKVVVQAGDAAAAAGEAAPVEAAPFEDVAGLQVVAPRVAR